MFCVSVAAACCLPWRGHVMWRGRFSSGVLLMSAVSPVSGGVVISVVPVACRGAFYRVGVVLLCRLIVLACHRRCSWSAARGVLAIACDLVLRRPRCLLRSVVVGSSWADRRRVSSSWFLLVVGRRCSSSSCLLVLGCRRRLVSSVCSLTQSCLSSGGAICVPSSRVARCLEFRSSWSFVHRRLVVSSRARPSSSLLASPPRLVRWRREYLVPAYCLSPIRKSPRPSYRGAGRFFPFRLFFPVLVYSSMMA